jgi:MauM/NapG family ferredoxin protein
VTWKHWRRVRQAVQVAAFGLYTYLLVAALHTRAVFPLADLFFRLDPLASIASMVAARSWIPRAGLAAATLILTVIVGRAWCGWLCPLGTLLEWIRFPRAVARAVDPRWRTVKYVLLIAVLAAALLGSLFLLVLDPIALFTRAMTTVVLPALNYAITAVERALYPIRFLRPALYAVETIVRGPVIPVEQPVFRQSVLIGLVVVGVVALNAFSDRFWCRYLCPLGGLLGLLSKVSLIRPRPGATCNQCGVCAGVCRLEAIEPERQHEVIASECTVCLDCMAACPQSGYGFALHRTPARAEPFDPSRRQVITALGASAGGVLLLRSGPHRKAQHATLLRPPGVQGEGEFLSRCIRCGQCMKVCPTSALQPALTESGLEGLWSPVLVPRLGYCDYGCAACGDICPTDAIPTLSLGEKREQVLGLARVDRDRCLPWAYGTPCIVCEEMCPVPEKAIRLEEASVVAADGREQVLQRPIVLRELCIGCGICEHRCPMAGLAAIRVLRA